MQTKVAMESATDEAPSRNLQDFNRTLDETLQISLLDPTNQKKPKHSDLGCTISRKIWVLTVCTVLMSAFLAVFIALVIARVPHLHHMHTPNHTLALQKALMFFNAQRSGNLPKHDNVSWRGNSCLNDGNSDLSSTTKDLVGVGDTSGGSTTANDQYCWMCPEDIDYDRPVQECINCCDLAAALAAASIVFKDNEAYSQKLVHGARILFHFSREYLARNSAGGVDAGSFYNSTSYWDEFIWSGAWMYYATGDSSYLLIANRRGIASHAGVFRGILDNSVRSWDNKIADAAIDYILGKNPQNMSAVMGFGNHYPKHVHHRGASISKNEKKYTCKEGWKWRDSSEPKPNTLVGPMVADPDKHDSFHDVRSNYNYSEPTLAGNAGLVAALVALSSEKSTGIDKNTIFSAVPPLFPAPSPSLAP